jgi:hypothetical protein
MRTHRIPSNGIVTHLPLPKTADLPKPFFSLFEKTAEGYKRISTEAYYSERVAFHIFCDRIQKAPLTYSIRPVKLEKPKAGKFKGVTYNPLRDSPLRERVRK